MKHPLDFFKFCPHCGSDNFAPNNNSSKKCSACGFVMYKNPVAAVACIITDDMGRILVLRRAKNPAIGMLDLPGGFVDIGETAESAAIREVKEELNIDVISVRYLFGQPNTYDWMGYDTATLDLFFECTVRDFSNMKLDTSENSTVLFIAPGDIKVTDFGFESMRAGLVKFINKQ